MNQTNQQDELPFNFERLALIYAPLIIAWFIGINSVAKQIGSLVNAALLVTVVIAIVFVLVRKVEITIFMGRTRVSALKYVFLSIIPLILTVACNFNAIYPALMKNFLLREELAQKQAALQSVLVEAKRTMGTEELEKWRTRIDGLISQFESQANSPQDKGIGDRSESILQEIEKELGENLTRHRIHNGNIEAVVARYKFDIIALRGKSKKQLDNVSKEGAFVLTKSAIDDAVAGLEKANLILDGAKPEPPKPSSSADVKAASALPPQIKPVDAEEYALSAIKKAVIVHDEAIVKIKQFDAKAFPERQIQLTVNNAEMGKLAHTFESAKAHLDISTTWVAIALALLIDLWAIILALLYTSPGTTNPANRMPSNGHSVSRLHRLY